ncbi:PorT family protein [Flavihumibacter profundi]|uniref:PorT family protein n=1 Tax=Flavihumibacter profundi TaxID=2716883 RepID=UPI001CC5BCD9|nr:PorT family protein [Flavihumibacter profundi]MBZ5856776.1 PorT family protein [Flavihumibacter profundi]
MDKEQYNSFDDLFREAVRQPGPPVNEEAWQKMEAMLDDEKKKRRRIIFWWWWFGALLLIGGTIAVTKFLRSPGIENDQPAAKIQQQLIESNKTNRNISPSNPINGKNENLLVKADTQTKSIAETGVSQISENGIDAGIKPIVPGVKAARKEQRRKSEISKISIGQNIKQTKNGKVKQKNGGETQELGNHDEVLVQPESVETAQPVIADTVKPIAQETPENLAKRSADSMTQQAATSQAASKKITAKLAHLYIYGAGAPEWSFVKSRGVGDAALSFGGGVGYSFNKHWAIQAGIFRSGKIYTAGEGDYTPKPGSYYDNPNYVIESVDADCSVLEIPISVRYIFAQRKKNNWFAIAGLSSAIMKKEHYEYDYLRYGNPVYSTHTFETGVFNLFSSASVSVGYERVLNKKISILAAPYFNIPLRGIGEGKVFIYSFGLQAGLKYNLPF